MRPNINVLLRRMCLQHWSFCNLAALGGDQVTLSWKKYFQQRSHLEKNMTEGRTGNYTCKSLRGHTGMHFFLFIRNILSMTSLCLLSNLCVKHLVL